MSEYNASGFGGKAEDTRFTQTAYRKYRHKGESFKAYVDRVRFDKRCNIKDTRTAITQKSNFERNHTASKPVDPAAKNKRRNLRAKIRSVIVPNKTNMTREEQARAKVRRNDVHLRINE